jgi:hypothetical protein
MTNCCDLSKYTEPRDPAALQRLKDAGVQLAIIQAHPDGYGRPSSLQLFRSAAAVGMPWDAYIYGYCAFPDWTEGALQTLDLAVGEGLRPLRVWYDIEDVNAPAQRMSVDQRVAAYNRDLAKIDKWSADHGLPRPGVYSGGWYFAQYLPGVTAWADRDLWDSDYDGVPDVDHGFRPYGGWTARAIKQHVGTSTLAGVGGLDQNALSAAELQRVLQGEEVDVPVPQKYIEKFGEGITWEGVADNLEGIIGQVMQERDELQAQLDAGGGSSDAQQRLDRLREALQEVLAV